MWRGILAGNWTYVKSKHHVNYLELLAIYFGLQSFNKDKVHVHIDILWDNSITKAGFETNGCPVARGM